MYSFYQEKGLQTSKLGVNVLSRVLVIIESKNKKPNIVFSIQVTLISYYVRFSLYNRQKRKKKGKAIPVTDRAGP
jgi:hypothetical protein